MNDFWINLLCWLFVIGVFLNLLFSFAVLWLTGKKLDSERQYHRMQLETLQNRYRQDINDLCNRWMAKSYPEYEAYKNGEPKKPSKPNNFLKKAIEQNEQRYIHERQFGEDD